MKKIVLIGVVALTAASALARGRDTDKRRHRTMKSEIQAKAYQQATAEMSEKFGIVYVDWSDETDETGETRWMNNYERPILLKTSRGLCKYDKSGRLIRAGGIKDFEELGWRDARKKEIQEALWQDQTVVSNVVAGEETNAREFQDSTQDSQSRMGSLEELISLEEAMALAKDGKGKGYFQLALRYASGQELPCESRTAYKMLRKAADANYANAILVEGLLDEENLTATLGIRDGALGIRNGMRSSKTPSSKTPSWKDDGSSVRKALHEYCGNDAHFDTGKHSQEINSLTNEVAFAHVMGKYEKAKELGALTATNQIAALNKRLADFNKALADYTKALADYTEKMARLREAEERMEAQRMTEREESKKRRAIVNANNRKVHAVVGTNEINRYRIAFKEMFSYDMGERIVLEDGDGYWRTRKLRKPYRNFTSMRLRRKDDCLVAIEIELESENKNSYDALKKEAFAIVKDLEQRYDVEFGAETILGNWSSKPQRYHWRRDAYGWEFDVTVNNGTISVQVSDADLEWELCATTMEHKE